MAIISNATTIADNGAFSVSLGALVHIKTLTASNSGTLSFVHGSSSVIFDNTYPIYKFEFINCHPTAHDANAVGGLNFNVTTDGSNYNIAKTSTAFTAYHKETGGSAGMGYNVGNDSAQVTGAIPLSGQIINDNDASVSGELYIFNPSSTTFLKHFITSTNRMDMSGGHRYQNLYHIAGYANTTSALTGVQFSMWSGNIGAGKIKLYGVKD